MNFGIDFGTTNSVLTQWNGTETEVVPLDTANLDDWDYPGFDQLFPSFVGVSSTRPHPLFGWEAKLRSELAVPAAKRMLAGDGTIPVADRDWPASTVAAGIFRTIRDRAAQDHLLTLEQAVVTVPANSAGAARYRTRAAAREAGIKVDSLINEPTAAAVYYKHLLGADTPERILTFDWGGGTIDVTVLEAEDGVFQEQAARGVARLGGMEIDARLSQLVLSKCKRGPQSAGEEAALQRDVELAKIRLSGLEMVAVPAPGGGMTVEVSRAEFETAIRDVADSAVVPIRDCLKDLRMQPEDIDSVLMIGGSSRIPLVRGMAGEIVGDRLVAEELCDPLTSVARGAAIAAAMNAQEVDIDLAVATTHALGTVSTHKEAADKRRVFSEIIPRSASLPREERKHYQPNKKGQKSVNLEIGEGDPNDSVIPSREADNGSNICLTEQRIELPPFEEPEDASFTLKYAYNIDGILHVSATLDRDGRKLVEKEVDAFGLSGTGVGVNAQSLHDFLTSTPQLPKRATSPMWQGEQHADPEPEEQPAARQAEQQTPPGQPRAAPQPPSTSAVKKSPAAGADSPQERAPRSFSRFVVDGSNLAWGSKSADQGGSPTLARLWRAIDHLKEDYPDAEITVFVDASFRHQVPQEEQAEVDRAVSEGRITPAPARTVGGADVYVLDVARKTRAVVVSNDTFRQHEEFQEWLATEGRVLGGQEVRGLWSFQKRSLGQRR